MDQIEFVLLAVDVFDHCQMVRQRVYADVAQPQSRIVTRNQARAGNRIPARKKRNVVPLPNQFLRQIRHYALSASIQLRWNTLEKWRHLCDTHTASSNRSRGLFLS